MTLLNFTAFEPREYQKNIAESASNKNTLVVLPTGMGKTIIALLVGVKRLEKFPNSKILITAPTRPLSAQHKSTFEKLTFIDPKEIILITGKTRPSDRKILYEKGKVLIATPQTIKNDLKDNRLSLENFSFIVFDEAHRCVKDYAYTFIAKEYMKQSKFPLILGLTASPGGTYEKIEEINRNLFIENVEIRTELDKDVKDYVKPVEREWIYVELPAQFSEIKSLLEEKIKKRLEWLKEHDYIDKKISKKKLLLLQNSIIQSFDKNVNYERMWAAIKLAEAIKFEHALELLETQGLCSLLEYLKKIQKSEKKVDKRIRKEINEVLNKLTSFQLSEIDHPKIEKLIEIVRNLIKEKSDIKILIFANYRTTVHRICEILRKNGILCEILIGQKTKEMNGLSQQKQIEIIRRFANNEFNVLIGTSISEEGLDVPAVDCAIFYEPVPSEIRTIQRRGRVGRHVAGKVIFLITKNTRDEGYYWAALHKERKMKGILYNMKKRNKKSLKDWIV